MAKDGAADHAGYHVTPFDRSRQVIVDTGFLAARRHLMHGFVELDVTQARQFISAHKVATGESLSFTAFLIGCLGRAVAEHPHVQAFRNWRGQLLIFDDVDVVTLIEPEHGGVAIPHILRGVNRRSFTELNAEIRAIQTQPRRSKQKAGRLARFGPSVPRPARMVFYRILRLNPQWLKRIAGTVVVTAVGMFFQGGAGWGLGFLAMHSLGLTVGSIVQRPTLVDGQLALHDYLCLTVSLDHDVVDGGPGARFMRRFRELVEGAYGLCPDPA